MTIFPARTVILLCHSGSLSEWFGINRERGLRRSNGYEKL